MSRNPRRVTTRDAYVPSTEVVTSRSVSTTRGPREYVGIGSLETSTSPNAILTPSWPSGVEDGDIVVFHYGSIQVSPVPVGVTQQAVPSWTDLNAHAVFGWAGGVSVGYGHMFEYLFTYEAGHEPPIVVLPSHNSYGFTQMVAYRGLDPFFWWVATDLALDPNIDSNSTSNQIATMTHDVLWYEQLLAESTGMFGCCWALSEYSLQIDGDPGGFDVRSNQAENGQTIVLYDNLYPVSKQDALNMSPNGLGGSFYHLGNGEFLD